MSIIGLDFGSHSASIAIWYEEKNSVEVLADDLGSRTIPCAVAFRGDEVITGQAAIAQQHKNPSNTFEDVRSLLFNGEIETINVPVLEKDLSVQEIASHFFRNIHNQIKQQVGKIVRDCIVSVPFELNENIKKRVIESAQAGGIRIKSFVLDAATTLMAHELDNPSKPTAKTLVIDIGWNSAEVSLFNVSGGLFFPIAHGSSTDVSGKIFVKLMAEHCAKDFQRKAKFPCTDNSRSMMRLRRECENAMRTLSTGQEATIDIDSLCEGVDYSAKITRARFEDLITIPFIHLKNTINTVLTNAKEDASKIQLVLMAGGPGAIPKVLTTMKALFTSATFPRVKFESNETACIGACQQGKKLIEQGLIDNAPTNTASAPILTHDILLSTTGSSDVSSIIVLSRNTVLPTTSVLSATVPNNTGYFKLLAKSAEAADNAVEIGEVVFTIEKGDDNSSGDNNNVNIEFQVQESGDISVQVTQTATKLIIGNLTVPAGK